MTEPHPATGPILLCAGPDPAASAGLARVAADLLADRPIVVLAIWAPPAIAGPFDGVMDALYDTHADLRAEARRVASEGARGAYEALAGSDREVTTRICGDATAPWHTILEVAEQIDASVIVAGTTDAPPAHPGMLGREARALAHRTRRPLLLAPPGSAGAPAGAPALFAGDGSDAAAHALRTATGLLRSRPAIAATAWETTSYAVGVALLAIPSGVAEVGAERIDDAARTHAADTASDAGALLAAAGWSCESVALEARHNAAEAIASAAAEHDAAVVVTGTRGRSPIAATLLGSTAEALLRHAGRPVLVVPPGPAAE